jgi:hypothetical protein
MLHLVDRRKLVICIELLGIWSRIGDSARPSPWFNHASEATMPTIERRGSANSAPIEA